MYIENVFKMLSSMFSWYIYINAQIAVAISRAIFLFFVVHPDKFGSMDHQDKWLYTLVVVTLE